MMKARRTTPKQIPFRTDELQIHRSIRLRHESQSFIDASDRLEQTVMIQALITRFKRLGLVFALTVAIPTTLSVIYFGLIASDVYISESKFVIRSPDKAPRSGFGLLINSVGFSRAGDEIYVVDQYVQSRDALTLLNRQNRVREAFQRPGVSILDRFNPLGLTGTFEDLYDYYRKMVIVDNDTATSITTLSVRAFTGQDAHAMNEQLLRMAEATVNRLSERGRQDLVKFARIEVENAKRQSYQAAEQLARYRNRAGVVDPERQATVQLQMISKLQDEVIANRAQLREVRQFAPRNPQIPVLETRVAGLEAEVEAELDKVTGNSRSLAGTAVEFQRLQVESQFTDKQLAAALASLEDAINEARRKQAYVERIDQPNLPDKALEPRRIRGILSTLALGLVAWGIATMLLAGIREHQD